jgi:hypothetical protein
MEKITEMPRKTFIDRDRLVIIGFVDKTPEDSEKLLTPGIVYTTATDGNLPGKAFALHLGWWDWSVGFCMILPYYKENEG